jgi:hypothetical protein
MKNDKIFRKDDQDAIRLDPGSTATEMNVISKVGRLMKKIIYITSLAGLGLLGNACTTGYVATEPAYVEYTRPPRPSTNHIWVDDNYEYSRQNHAYVQKNGYWKKPGNNSAYIPGHWQSSPRGQYWVQGHWQRNRR